MKIISLFCLIIMIACSAARYGLNYWLGYYETSYTPIGYQDYVIIVGALFFVGILITWLVSLIVRKHRLWTSSMVGGLLILMVIIRIVPPPGRMIAYGLRDRLVNDNSVGELRRLAQDIDQLPAANTEPVGTATGGKQFMREELTKLGLKEKYAILRWVKATDFDGPSYVHEEDGVVDVRWGSAYEGHWGFSVNVKGGRLDLSSEAGNSLRLSDDIVVVSDVN